MKKNLRQFYRRYWFRLAVLGAVALPALLTQTLQPVISFRSWEVLSDRVYVELATLLSLGKETKNTPSDVIIIEVDKKTINTFGWPINRAYYTQLLNQLKDNGHPYLLSMLPFQALHKSSSFQQDEFKRLDEELALAVQSYGRVIGANMNELDGEEFTDWQEEELMPRVALSEQQTPPEELPYLPLHFLEDDMFLNGQLAFGPGIRTGDVSVAYCTQMYITDAGFKGAFVIPSALTWAAAYASGRSFTTTTGAAWPRQGEEAQVSDQSPMKIGYRHCVSSPATVTDDVLADRGITKLSMAEYLDGTVAKNLAGKLVILAMEDVSAFAGPGKAYVRSHADGGRHLKDNMVKNYQFAARLLDDMLIDKAIRRETLANHNFFSILPICGAAILMVFSFFGLTRLLLLTASIGLIAALGWSTWQLHLGQYDIPIQFLTYTTTVMFTILALNAYLRVYSLHREIRFAGRLRRRLAQCNTVFQIEDVAQEICASEFLKSNLHFKGFDRELYKAANNAKSALRYLDHPREAPLNDTHNGEQTKIRHLRNKPALRSILSQERSYNVNLMIASETSALGEAAISLTCMRHEDRFIRNLLDTLRLELCQHWNRVKLLVDQKLADYRALMEQTRSDILSRFLTQALVSRFSNKLTMEENLHTVLTPRPTRVALMQADIRGYSRISAKLAPKDMVELLRGYYKNVVDAAQTVAQVKLIGDCIFLFIEEHAESEEHSAADLCLQLASILVQETNKQNAAREAQNEEPMYFGIAIHYGEVVVGNLSSDSCIDYTVIGPNVNLVARLEEITKHEEIGSILGRNCTIVSPEAFKAMTSKALPEAQHLNLKDLGVSVRSFNKVETVYGIKAEDLVTFGDVYKKKLPQAG